MKRKIIAFYIAIVLIALLIAVNPVSAQLCFENPTKTQCEAAVDCYWCGTTGECNPFAECLPCESLVATECNAVPDVCQFCSNKMICYPNERPCTCGDGVVQRPEQCDGGANCNTYCQCPEGYVYDGGNGCTPYCGDGILVTGEECEPAYSRYCDFVTCTCLDGSIPDTEYPGYCLPTCVPTTEVCDGVDNDCDSAADEDLGSTTCGVGSCAKTVENCLNSQTQTCVPGAPTAEICDNSDNDCDGAVDENLGSTTCGVGSCARTVANCLGGLPQTCVPGAPTAEICDNSDNDCDGAVDEDLTAPTQSCTMGTGACQNTGTQAKTCLGVNGWSDWGVCSASPGNPTAETCNGLDDDCDGAVDDELTAPTQSCTVGTGACQNTGTRAKTCLGVNGWSDWGVCSASPGNPTPETCNSIDDDCDGQADNGLTFDLDSDGYSSPDSCSGTGNDCNDNNAAINPGTFEIPGNSVDENCDAVNLCDPNPPSYTQWKNHGAFVSCVSRESEKLLALGLITQAQKDKIVSGAAKTTIGKK